MGKFIDLTEQTFGRLTVIERVPNRKNGVTLWRCRCVCGNELITAASRLRNGTCQSCGCFHKEFAALRGASSKTHGLTNTRLYRIWTNMKTRCYNKSNPNYARWGARGIQVCDEWRCDFSAFYIWAMQSGYADTLFLDRIDNDGMYSPTNCRWATAKEQANNTRKTSRLSYKGLTHSLHEWGRILNIEPSTLFYRLRAKPHDCVFAELFNGCCYGY